MAGLFAGKGDSFFWEGDDGVSIVNYSVVGFKESHSLEDVIVV